MEDCRIMTLGRTGFSSMARSCCCARVSGRVRPQTLRMLCRRHSFAFGGISVGCPVSQWRCWSLRCVARPLIWRDVMAAGLRGRNVRPADWRSERRYFAVPGTRRAPRCNRRGAAADSARATRSAGAQNLGRAHFRTNRIGAWAFAQHGCVPLSLRLAALRHELTAADRHG